MCKRSFHSISNLQSRQNDRRDNPQKKRNLVTYFTRHKLSAICRVKQTKQQTTTATTTMMRKMNENKTKGLACLDWLSLLVWIDFIRNKLFLDHDGIYKPMLH